VPAGRGAACLPEDVFPDLPYVPELLGKPNELIRGEQTLAGTTPPCKRLESGRSPSGEVDNGLEVAFDFAVDHSTCKVPKASVPLPESGIHTVGEPSDASICGTVGLLESMAAVAQ
jgi:hypothetical protein